MDFQTAQQRAQQLREQIEYYSKLYYEQDARHRVTRFDS